MLVCSDVTQYPLPNVLVLYRQINIAAYSYPNPNVTIYLLTNVLYYMYIVYIVKYIIHKIYIFRTRCKRYVFPNEKEKKKKTQQRKYILLSAGIIHLRAF